MTARFIRARTASKQHGQFGSEADALSVALVDYEFVPAYVKAHGLEGMERESDLCEQMCALLPTKIVHLRSLEKNAGGIRSPWIRSPCSNLRSTIATS